MAELVFDCLDVTPLAYAAEPTLNVRVRVAETTGVQIHVIALRCQNPHPAGAAALLARRGRTARGPLR